MEDRLCVFLSAETEIFATIEPEIADDADSSALVNQATKLAKEWPQRPPFERRQILLTLLARVDILRDCVGIHVLVRELISILRGEPTSPDRPDKEESNPRNISWTIPVRLRRTGIEKRLLIDCASDIQRRAPDHSLSRLIAKAHQDLGMLMRSEGKTMTQLAQEAGVTRSYFSRILRLSFLAPEIVTTILQNRHPIDLTAKRLANDIHLPVAWDAQKALLGISRDSPPAPSRLRRLWR